MENDDPKNREFSRVDAYLSLEVRPVPPDEKGCLRSRTSHGFAAIHVPPMPDLEDSALAECMSIINAKLDAILKLLSSERKDLHSLQTAQVNISGSGMGFHHRERYSPGDLLEVKLVLPTAPELILHVYGEVVRSEQGTDNRFRTSVRFTVIDEDIRERIVKFVFDRQRELLRKQRGL